MPFFFSSGRDFTRELFVFAITVWLSMMVISASGQARLEATVTDTRGVATLIIGTSSRPILRGERLAPGYEIETSAGGRVILRLTDGSLVTIHPNSRVVIEDFRAAPSVRELIRVLAGYVRVKIYHTGKRPNPYRVNTPVASIAVRGTEFGVNVALTGETRVIVFEGLVEVTSQINPRQKRLLTPGRSIVVRPSGDIGLLAPGPGSELNALTRYQFASPFYQVEDTVQGYTTTLVFPAMAPTFERFLASADSHFDSLENPAFAAQFTRSDGRFYLLPSVTGLHTALENPTYSYSISSNTSSIAEQTTFFSPVKGSRFVLGGNLTIAHINLQAGLTSYTSDASYSTEDSGKLNLTTTNGSFIAARRFGSSERTSLGLGVDILFGHTERRLRRSFPDPDDPPDTLFVAETSAKRARVAIGLAHDFAEGKKLGIYYRYGITTYADRNPVPGLGIIYRTASSEIGARWRSPLTKRLYYGLHSKLLIDKVTDTQNYFGGSERGLNEWSNWRAVFGGGVGYEIPRQTTIAFDIAGGTSQITYMNRFDGNGELLQEPQIRSLDGDRFLTLHAGGQTDLGSRFFANGSLFWERKWLTTRFFSSPFPVPSISHYQKIVANIGPGWRIRRNVYAQYILSWSDVNKNKSHSVMLRYNFGFGDQ
jgi:hypothetical protein